MASATVPHIDSRRLWQRVEDLSRFTDPQRPWTRRAFGELHAQSRAWLRGQMEAALAQVGGRKASVAFSSYGLSEPSGFVLKETWPPCACTLSASAWTSWSVRMPRAGTTPMPSCEASKLKKVVRSEGVSRLAAQPESFEASPVESACSTSGASGNWYTIWASSWPFPK